LAGARHICLRPPQVFLVEGLPYAQ
jgi:hypothetical protein